MACAIPVDCDGWSTVSGGTWSNYRVQVGSSFYWFCEQPDPQDPHGNIWQFNLEDNGTPPQNAARISQDNWNDIKNADCVTGDGHLVNGDTCWCVQPDVVNDVLWAVPDVITCP